MHSWKINKLQVTNFRNLQPDVLEFSDSINCILGENGNGKTNILEALHVLIKRKSFRKNASFPQYLGIDGENPEIYFSSVFKDENENKMPCSGKMRDKTSEWYLDGKPSKRKLDVGIVFINPFDSNTFHLTPAFRRNWVDSHLSQVSDVYKKLLSQYTQMLRFRNNLLSKKPNKFREQILASDPQFIKASIELTNMRIDFLNQINPFITETFFKIFSEEHELMISIDSKVAGSSEEFLQKILQENFEKDIIIGHTSYGIHKDDYVLLFDGLNSFDYCSLGQQKMSYLSLLFAYIELFRYKFKTFPIVLIDDVSGELDRFRWGRLIDYLETSKFQVLITTANEEFKKELEKIEGSVKFFVTNGSTQKLS